MEGKETRKGGRQEKRLAFAVRLVHQGGVQRQKHSAKDELCRVTGEEQKYMRTCIQPRATTCTKIKDWGKKTHTHRKEANNERSKQ